MDKGIYPSNVDLKLIITKDMDKYEPSNDEKRKDGIMGLIKKLEERLIKNGCKMTEIGNILMKMKGSPEQEQIPFREKFYLFEDEQISIRNLISKLENL